MKTETKKDLISDLIAARKKLFEYKFEYKIEQKARDAKIKEVYDKCVKKWGANKQVMVAIEELAELIVALSKRGRDVNGSTLEEVIDEIADVQIMAGQLAFIFGEEAVEKRKEEKLKRLAVLLGGVKVNGK